MLHGWTREKIEQILIQIQQQTSLFKPYYFISSKKRLQLLGSGGSSMVFQGRHNWKKNSTYAMKVTLAESGELPNSLLNIVDSNIVNMYRVMKIRVWLDEHDMVVRAKDHMEFMGDEIATETLDLRILIMEELEPIITTNWMTKKKSLFEPLALYQEEEVLKIAYDIGKALAVTHEHNLLHRDVKLENIFYDKRTNSYKLGDFGIAKKTKAEMSAFTIAFTKGYGAPEVVTSGAEPYDHTADIYSFGMVLYVLLNDLKFPNSDTYHVNVSQQYQEGYLLPKPQHGSEKLFAIISKMCAFHPDQRYQSMEEVLCEIDGISIGNEVKFKKYHKEASLMLGIIFWLVGVVGWNLVFDYEMKVITSVSVYFFSSVVLLKGVRRFQKKNTTGISTIILCLGCYLLWLFGFSWNKLLLLLGILISGTISFLCASGFIMTMLITWRNNGEHINVNVSDYKWLVILLIILSIMLFYEYFVMKQKDQELALLSFKKNHLWHYGILLFSLNMINGWLTEMASFDFLYYLVGEIDGIVEWVEVLKSWKMQYVGLGGLVFSLGWVVRGKILCGLSEKKE